MDKKEVARLKKEYSEFVLEGKEASDEAQNLSREIEEIAEETFGSDGNPFQAS